MQHRDETAYDARTKTIPRRNPLPTAAKQKQIDAHLQVFQDTPADQIWANNPPDRQMEMQGNYERKRPGGYLPRGNPISHANAPKFYIGGSAPNAGNDPGLGIWTAKQQSGLNMGLNLVQLALLGLIVMHIHRR